MSRPTGFDDPLIISRLILGWYDAHRRELPWRETSDPWAILVSEIMLQQTTVAAVVPYYERFLKRWPCPADLAAAAQDELLAEWAGLGYYGRAHRLQAAAQVVAEAGGVLPETRQALLHLPGIGDYTAAAVASIAFGEAVAAIDGNVERVLCRFLAEEANPRQAATRRRLRELAETWLDPDRPGDSNQGLIELGATVCRPRSPHCHVCPLADRCQALAMGDPERFPRLPPRRATVRVTLVAAVIQRRGRWLMSHREAGPNKGFAEWPSVTVPSERCDDRGRPLDSCAEWLSQLADVHGLGVRPQELLDALRHTITHHRITVYPFAARLISGRLSGSLFWWQPERQTPPLTTAARRILSAVTPTAENTETAP